MKVVAIERRGIYISLDFHINEILMLAALMDKAEINIDPADKLMVDGAKWLHETFEPKLKWFQEQFEVEDLGSYNPGDESQEVH